MPEISSDNPLIHKVRQLNMAVPLRRKSLLTKWANDYGITPQEMLQLLSRAEVSRIRELEKGPLYHYHTMPFSRLEDALQDGALESMNIQKERGREFESSGSRPDVVQFTRDRYKANGELSECGVNSAIKATGDMCVLVFDPRIMGLPDYDITGEYPSIPRISLNNGTLIACLYHNPQQARELFTNLAEENPGLIFATPEEWMGNIENPKMTDV